MLARNHKLIPLFSARSRQEFDSRSSSGVISELQDLERSLSNGVAGGIFSVDGFCIPCGKTVSFRVDMQAGGRQEDGIFIPNWRERLICPSCRMSNRQRLMSTLVMQHLELCATRQDVYLMEQITPLYKWIANKFDQYSIVGSEYIGSDYQGGDIVGPLDYQAPLRFDNLLNTARHKLSLFYSMFRMGGIRHEDITKLSFSDASLDLIISNDVFEHVPDPKAAFRECARVLRSGGLMFATIPFHINSDISVVRAQLTATEVHNLLPPMYHGNPVSADGSLVFTDFGWDIIRLFLEAGFSDGMVEVYGCAEYGHLGGGQIIFKATK